MYQPLPIGPMDCRVLYVGLSQDQAKAWEQEGCIRKHWFYGTIPLKKTLLAAKESYLQAHDTIINPPFMAEVTISSVWFMALSDADFLRHVPLHDGYRLGLDIDVDLMNRGVCICDVKTYT